jgi:hypothetical protein
MIAPTLIAGLVAIGAAVAALGLGAGLAAVFLWITGGPAE